MYPVFFLLQNLQYNRTKECYVRNFITVLICVKEFSSESFGDSDGKTSWDPCRNSIAINNFQSASLRQELKLVLLPLTDNCGTLKMLKT